MRRPACPFQTWRRGRYRCLCETHLRDHPRLYVRFAFENDSYEPTPCVADGRFNAWLVRVRSASAELEGAA